MIVEVFVRGTNPSFSQCVNTFWGIIGISVDNGNFVLKTKAPELNIILPTAEYELRVTY